MDNNWRSGELRRCQRLQGVSLFFLLCVAAHPTPFSDCLQALLVYSWHALVVG